MVRLWLKIGINMFIREGLSAGVPIGGGGGGGGLIGREIRYLYNQEFHNKHKG